MHKQMQPYLLNIDTETQNGVSNMEIIFSNKTTEKSTSPLCTSHFILFYSPPFHFPTSLIRLPSTISLSEVISQYIFRTTGLI